MPLTFSEADAQKMRELQVELSTVLRRANAQHMEAGLAAFACIRCARNLLDFYPAGARELLLEAIIPFLRGEASTSGLLVQ